MRIEVLGGKYVFRTVEGDYRVHIDRYSDKDWVVIEAGHKAVVALMSELDARGSKEPGRGLAFDDPMSHPLVLRMLSERLDKVQDQIEQLPINRLIEVLTKRCRVCGAFGHTDQLETAHGGSVTKCPEREKGHEYGGYR